MVGHLLVTLELPKKKKKEGTLSHMYKHRHSILKDSVDFRLKAYVLINWITAHKGWGLIKNVFIEVVHQLKL